MCMQSAILQRLFHFVREKENLNYENIEYIFFTQAILCEEKTAHNNVVFKIVFSLDSNLNIYESYSVTSLKYSSMQ